MVHSAAVISTGRAIYRTQMAIGSRKLRRASQYATRALEAGSSPVFRPDVGLLRSTASRKSGGRHVVSCDCGRAMVFRLQCRQKLAESSRRGVAGVLSTHAAGCPCEELVGITDWLVRSSVGNEETQATSRH